MRDLVIVSMHEKGFPQADFYADAGDISADEFNMLGISPDSFFTMKRGETLEAAFAKARKKWPGANVMAAEPEEDDDE